MTMLSQEIEATGGASFRIGYERLVDRTLSPGPLARLAARARCVSLDRALIAGADPTGSPLLAARAAQLTSTRSRAAIAAGLKELVRHGTEPSGAGGRSRDAASCSPAPRRCTSLPRCCSDEPLYARGIAMLGKLLTDDTGPAHLGAGEDLARLLAQARAAMAGCGAERRDV